ncbi:MAG: hypothetical protein IPJ77_21300 [Planctomycetes bacterium]|nr:hypothetical protein [Planctomycetota bacterium]
MSRIWFTLVFLVALLPAVFADDDVASLPPDQVCGSDTMPRTAWLGATFWYGDYATEEDAMEAWDDPWVLKALYDGLGAEVFWNARCAECAQPTSTPRCPRQFFYSDCEAGDLEVVTVLYPSGRWGLRIRITGNVGVVMRCRVCIPPAT